MPYKSEKQRKYFWMKANDKSLSPKERAKWKRMAEEWESHTGDKKLPEKVGSVLRMPNLKRFGFNVKTQRIDDKYYGYSKSGPLKRLIFANKHDHKKILEKIPEGINVTMRPAREGTKAVLARYRAMKEFIGKNKKVVKRLQHLTKNDERVRGFVKRWLT